MMQSIRAVRNLSRPLLNRAFTTSKAAASRAAGTVDPVVPVNSNVDPGAPLTQPKNTLIPSEEFTAVVRAARSYFESKGLVEVHTQNRLSILAACEDPWTISTFDWQKVVYPLPQTGQMWLEYEILSNPHWNGCYTVSTSYRNEPNPIPGRHDLVFPMIEFEHKGGIEELEAFERGFLEHLGFGDAASFAAGDYIDVAREYNVREIEAPEELKLEEQHGSVFFLKNFPQYTSPFWNMKEISDSRAAKIDVIVAGQETIGSAERSTDIDEMRHRFHTISDGEYANKLYNLFGKERVERELEDYFKFDFFERSGAGIGVTRLIHAMKKYDVLKHWMPKHE